MTSLKLTVSVVVPTKDRPSLLRRALSSVVQQNGGGDVEVCIANDGGSRLDLPSALTRTLNIRIIELPRTLGVPTARNAALELASGDVIAYLDDDDYFLAGHLRSTTDAIALGRADLAVTSVFCCHNASGHLDVHFGESFDSRFLAVTNSHPPVSIVHRRLNGKLFDESLTVMEDWDLLQRLTFEIGMASAFFPEPTAVYDRVSVVGATMERLSAETFARDYAQIIAKWKRGRTDKTVARYQRHVRAWYSSQNRAKRRGDYEVFHATLRSRFQAEAATDQLSPESRTDCDR